MRELLVESVEEQGEMMLVTTTYGTVKYPYAFSDLMIVEGKTYEDYAQLEFSAEIDEAMFKLYTLTFNGEEGIPVGTLQDGDKAYAVTAQFHDFGEADNDTTITLSALQETFNDVINSLSENKGFTAAD